MNARYRKSAKNRDGSTFLAIPHVVLESPDYLELSHAARSLLFDIASQYKGGNNGKLVACMKYLKSRGWNSNDTLNRGISALLKSHLLIRTRMGARPNKAAWYALGWVGLEVTEGLDINPKDYRRGSYRFPPLKPTIGVERPPTAPIPGLEHETPAPPGGAMPPTCRT